MAGTIAGLCLVSPCADQAPELVLCAAVERCGWGREELRLHLTAALPLATVAEIEAIVRGWQERHGSGNARRA